MTRFFLLALVVAACSKSDAPAPAAKLAPSEAGKTAPAEAAKAATPPATPSVPGARPASITDAHLASMDKLLKTFSDLGMFLDLAKTCDQKRSSLELASAQFAEIAPELARTIAETNADPAAEAWFDANYKPRLEAAALPLKNSAAACKDDPGFMKALAALPMMKKKS